MNLRTVWTLRRDFGAYMSKRSPYAGGRRGAIINVASLESFQGGINVPVYASAKCGAVQLTKSLSNQWAADGVNANSIAPGYIDTHMD